MPRIHAVSIPALAAALFLLILASPALCAENTDEAQRVRDEAEVSFVSTWGNTEITTFSLKNRLEVDLTDRDTLRWDASALLSENGGERTAERYATELRLDHSYTERLYSFAYGGWSKDEFKGIDQRVDGGAGAGYRLLDGPKHHLALEGGLACAYEEYTDGTDDTFPEGRGYAEYEYRFTEDTSASQSVEVRVNLSDTEDTVVRSVTAVTTSLTEILSLKTSYEVVYDNQPQPATLDETDSMLTVALVVTY